jgi:aminoglycoside phosphotransferase (APT) family kinase protein
MQRPWHPETVVDAALAADLIAHQWPELAPIKVEPLGEGWDNTAYKVNDRLVFRFPRREVAVPLLEAEARLLPEIAPTLPVAIPVPRFVGRPGERFRWPFLGYDWLPGRPASVVHLTADQKVRLAAPLGGFLGALHSFSVERATTLGATGDTIGRAAVATRAPAGLKVVDELATSGNAALGGLAGAVRAAFEEAPSIVAPDATALLHGDLYFLHLLVGADGSLCGVIDWGDIHLGHPAVDLSVAYGFLPPPARAPFLRAYGRDVDAGTLRLARFRALFHALATTRYALDVGDAPLQREGISSLRNALE